MTGLLVALCALAAAPAPAAAASRQQIVEDCADNGRMDGTYTAAELRDARRNLPSEAAEYTDCADQMRRAELAALEAMRRVDGPGQAQTGPGAVAVPTAAALLTPAGDAERDSLAAAARVAAPVQVAGATVLPGSAGFGPGALHNEMPVSLLLTLVALALLGFGGLSRRLWPRIA